MTAEAIQCLTTVSKQIMATALPIMRMLREPNADSRQIVTTIADKRNCSYEIALGLCQDIVLEMIDDARRVSSELPGFTEKSLEDEDERKTQFNFLRQVWFGDVYDVDGVDGLRKLCNDMSLQVKQITIETIVSKAMTRNIPKTDITD